MSNIKLENRAGSLNMLASLYAGLPKFMSSYSTDKNKINVRWTKAHILKAYSMVGIQSWENVAGEINQADQAYIAVMSDLDYVNEKSYNANKTYVTLKELQNAITLQDEDIFYIKYRNFIEEINLL